MRFLREHGVAIVTTLWLLALIAGASLLVATSLAAVPVLIAVKVFVSELHDRWST